MATPSRPDDHLNWWTWGSVAFLTVAMGLLVWLYEDIAHGNRGLALPLIAGLVVALFGSGFAAILPRMLESRKP